MTHAFAHLRRAQDIINNEGCGGPISEGIRHRRSLHMLPGYEGVSCFPPKHSKVCTQGQGTLSRYILQRNRGLLGEIRDLI